MDFVKKVKANAIFSSILTLAVGIILIVNPYGSSNVIAILVAALVIVAGVIDIIAYIKGRKSLIITNDGLFTGVLKIVLGIFMLTHTETIVSLMSFIFSIYVIADGVKNFDYSLKLKKINADGWAVHLILAILVVVSGIVMLFNPFGTTEVIGVWLGVILVCDGLVALFTIIRVHSYTNEFKEAYKDFRDEITGNIIDEQK